MAKAHKETTFLVSSAGTGFFYTNRKNRKKFKGEKKASITKYDPIARAHVLFEEKKLSRLKKKYKPQAKANTPESEAKA
jgi:large subunit ribosomal protein L33